MKMLLAALAVLFALPASAQIIVDKDKNVNEDPALVYIVVVPSFINKVSVRVDYGQPVKITKPGALYDAEGNFKNFLSIAEMFNYFEANGWELVSQISGIDATGSNGYLMRKK